MGSILYGLGFQYPGIIITEGVVLLLCLLWLVLLLSKVTFKKTFDNGKWENLFWFMGGFPTLMQLFYGSLYYLNYLQLGPAFEDHIYFGYTFFGLDSALFLPLLVFFSVYLFHFIRRLLCHHQNLAVTPTKRGGGSPHV